MGDSQATWVSFGYYWSESIGFRRRGLAKNRFELRMGRLPQKRVIYGWVVTITGSREGSLVFDAYRGHQHVRKRGGKMTG